MEKIGAFLIHGITKTPKELEKISFFLNKNGIKTCCPLLPGHGTGKNGETYFQDFWSTPTKKWIRYAEKEFLKFRKKCDKIYVGGVSLGGNISIKLASKYKVDGLILIGTPIFLSKILSIAYSTAKIILKIINKKNKGIFHGLPIKNILEIKDSLIDGNKKELKKINCPTLIFQSKKDDITNPKSALYIFKKIPNKNKKIIWFDHYTHGINVNSKKDSKIIAHEILQFFKIRETIG